MGSTFKYRKAVVKPTVIQKASDAAAAIIAKTDSPQSLKNKATDLQISIGAYNTAFDDYNSLTASDFTTASTDNEMLKDVKAQYTKLKTIGVKNAAYGVISAAEYLQVHPVPSL